MVLILTYLPSGAWEARVLLRVDIILSPLRGLRGRGVANFRYMAIVITANLSWLYGFLGPEVLYNKG